MNPRTRLIIIIAFIIVLAGVVVAFVLPSLQGGGTNNNQAQGNTTSEPSRPQTTGATPLPTYTPWPTLRVVVAVQNLNRGVTIPPNAIDVREWPEFAVPQSAFLATEDGGIPEGIVGKIARTDILREQPILTTMLVEDLQSLSRVGSDAAAVLPTGSVAVALPMDRITSVAYAVQDGDRVDVIVSMLFVDVDEGFQSITPNLITLFTQTEEGIRLGAQIQGRPETTTLGQGIISPSEPQRPRLATQRTIQDALVIHVGDFPIDGKLFRIAPPTPTTAPTPEGGAQQTGARQPTVAPTPVPPRPDIITLGVSPQDAVTLVWFIESKLPVSLALRSAGDSSKPPTVPVTLDYVMSEYGITLPGKTNFAIQPAIRSIRQLLAGEQISLSSSGS